MWVVLSRHNVDILVSNLLMYINLQTTFVVMQKKKSCNDVNKKNKLFTWQVCLGTDVIEW